MDKSILDVVHESAKDLQDAELLSPQTMREFDALCLPPVEELSWTDIKNIRLENNVSQAVFAAYLNTSVATVRKWESRGRAHNRPNGLAMKMLNLVDKYGIDILSSDVKIPDAKVRKPATVKRAQTRRAAKRVPA